jgi:hypothetical protein
LSACDKHPPAPSPCFGTSLDGAVEVGGGKGANGPPPPWDDPGHQQDVKTAEIMHCAGVLLTATLARRRSSVLAEDSAEAGERGG